MKILREVKEFDRDGRKEGNWEYEYESFTLYLKYKEDRLVSETSSFNTGRLRTKGNYSSGFRSGEWEIGSSRFKATGKYLDGKKHGLWVYTSILDVTPFKRKEILYDLGKIIYSISTYHITKDNKTTVVIKIRHTNSTTLQIKEVQDENI